MLAIQNARLFENIEAPYARIDEVADEFADCTRPPGADRKTRLSWSIDRRYAHEIKNPLNFVNNFSAISIELIDELREALGGVRHRPEWDWTGWIAPEPPRFSSRHSEQACVR